MSKINKYRAWREDIVSTEPYGRNSFEQKFMENDIEDIKTRKFDSFEERGFVKAHRADIMQYIGIDDKNRKEIYEGDIVKIHQFLFDGCEYEKEIIVSIEYMEDMACFGANLLQAEEIRKYMGYAYWDKEKAVVPLCNFYGLHEESFEVIGNVYENADLLKEVGKNE